MIMQVKVHFYSTWAVFRNKHFNKFIFTVTKKFWPLFRGKIEYGKYQRTIFQVPWSIVTVFVEIISYFPYNLRRQGKHKLLKEEAILPVKQKFWPIFSQSMEYDRRQRTIWKSPETDLIIIVPVKLFSIVPGRWTIFSKRLRSGWEKMILAQFFLKRPTVANLELHFGRLHRQLLQRLCKLLEHIFRT